MKIHTQWWRHVEAWLESGLSQADYCRQQGLNPKTFSTWARRTFPQDKDRHFAPHPPLPGISIQVNITLAE